MKRIAIVLVAALMLFVVSCVNEPQHEHKFSEEWKSNETQHWHECECKEKTGSADHDFETIIVDSTCAEEGSETIKCKVCGYAKSTKAIKKKDHTPSETPEVVKKSSCSEEGLEVVKCTVCHEVVSSSPIPCISHSWGVWVPDEEPGLMIRNCSECDATETRVSEILTAEVMNGAVAYDMLIDEVSSSTISVSTILSVHDSLLYDLKNVLIDGDVYTFEVKSHDEEKYHTYRIKYDGPNPSSVIIDGVAMGDDYDPMLDVYQWAFASYMMSGEEGLSGKCNKMVNVEVTSSGNTYTLNFEAEYDASKEYETRYMKITDSKGNIKLEYSLNCVGPKAQNSSITVLATEGIIKEAKAVGVFIIDDTLYDIDSVNTIIADMF